MNPPASNLDGRALAARYEALRKDAVEAGGRRHTGHGLVLFMRRGMAAWMKNSEDEPSRGAVASTASSAIGIPEGIERSLVNILAGMALATALEGVT